jgi:ankyrin repeat protein
MQNGWTALMWASRYGDLNVVQCLVEAGANLEAVDRVSVNVVWEYVDEWHGN